MTILRGFSLLILCLAVTSCGVKPGDVSAPEDAETSEFPRTYPDLSTDPRPEEK